MPSSARERATAAGETALAGTVVVELGSRIGAGVCGSLLAQLGATVVLFEASEADGVTGKWRHRAQFAAGKLSLRPGLAGASDRNLLRDLVARCDAIIMSSDVDGRSDDIVPARSEDDKVVCDVTAYGHSGPLSGRPDTEWQVQAASGIVETTGMADGAPVPIPLPVVEFMTGAYAAASTIAALRVRRMSGAGQAIDVALYDSAFSAMATFLPRVLAGSTEALRRAGNRHAMISPWNVYKARDGWILICVGSDAQWQRLCEIMGRRELRSDARFARTPDRLARAADTDGVVQAWVGERSIADCVAKLNEAQIACGPIVRIDVCPREPNLDHRGMIRRLRDPVTGREILVPGSPLRMSASGGVAPDQVPIPDADRKQIAGIVADRRVRVAAKPSARPSSALAGIRIIEIGHYTTVPLSTRLLASLGAEVIKIEPPEGEATRDWPPTQRGQGYFFTYTNSDKRSLVLDLRKDADTAILGDLIRSADVLIENLKPGTLARRGFSADDVAKLNPALIYCSISGFGAHSLYGGRPAYDSVVQAMSGIMDLVRSNGVPVKTGISSADLMGAEMGVLAVLAALAYRDRMGRGQYVDLSMQDIAAWLTQTAWNGEDTGGSAVRVIPCSDGHVVAEMEAAGLAGLTPEMLGPDAMSAAQLTRHEAAARLTRAGIPAASVLTVHEILAEPHTSSRGLWFPVTENGETWPLLASPLRLVGTPPVVSKPMPALGRDSAAILAALPRSAVTGTARD